MDIRIIKGLTSFGLAIIWYFAPVLIGYSSAAYFISFFLILTGIYYFARYGIAYLKERFVPPEIPDIKSNATPALRDLVINPGNFFRDIAAAPPRYKIPALIILAWGIFSAFNTFLMVEWLFVWYPFQQEIAQYSGLFKLFLIGVPAVFITPEAFVFWGLAAVGLYLISSIFSRTGSIHQVITTTAWGMIPLAICSAIQIPLFYLYRNAMSVSYSPAFINLTANSHGAASSMSSLTKNDIIYNSAFNEHSVISFGIFIIAMSGCCWFWFHALQHTRALTPKQAAITVLIPVILLFVFFWRPWGWE
ncbi:YIP1 family protein [Methanoregula sp.]|jgi:hypothetical protein|uniref:YIP1 family protein n=1 Tax=Methanoregula sp. TaxID=2052170 RepID=UPI003C1CF380